MAENVFILITAEEGSQLLHSDDVRRLSWHGSRRLYFTDSEGEEYVHVLPGKTLPQMKASDITPEAGNRLVEGFLEEVHAASQQAGIHRLTAAGTPPRWVRHTMGPPSPAAAL